MKENRWSTILDSYQIYFENTTYLPKRLFPYFVENLIVQTLHEAIINPLNVESFLVLQGIKPLSSNFALVKHDHSLSVRSHPHRMGFQLYIEGCQSESVFFRPCLCLCYMV